MFHRFFSRKQESAEDGEGSEVDSDLYLVRPQASCPNGHVVTLLEETLGIVRSCLLCYKQPKAKETYRCEECRWTVCRPCYSKLLRWSHLGLGGVRYFSEQAFPMCSSKHWFENYRMVHSKTCGNCRRSIVKKESYYACICYALCLQCHDIKLMEAGALWGDTGHAIRLMRCNIHVNARMVISQHILGSRCGKCIRTFRERDTVLACSISHCRYFVCVECLRQPPESDEERQVEIVPPELSAMDDGERDEYLAMLQSMTSTGNEYSFEEEEDEFPDSLPIDFVRTEDSDLGEDDHSQVVETRVTRNESNNIEDTRVTGNESANSRLSNYESSSVNDIDDVMDLFNRLEAGEIPNSLMVPGYQHQATVANRNNDNETSSNNDSSYNNGGSSNNERDSIEEMQSRILSNARRAFLRSNQTRTRSMAPPSHPPPPIPSPGDSIFPPSHPPPTSTTPTQSEITPQPLSTTTSTRRVTFATHPSTSSHRNGSLDMMNGNAKSSARSRSMINEDDLVEVDDSTPAILECTICSTYVKNRVLGCGHTLCSSCANTLKSSTKKCPFCNRPIQTVIQFYM